MRITKEPSKANQWLCLQRCTAVVLDLVYFISGQSNLLRGLALIFGLRAQGNEWKETVGKVFSVQKYKNRLKLDEYPVVKVALNYALQTVPQDYVFMPVELAKL
jgi:hypothetical protein